MYASKIQKKYLKAGRRTPKKKQFTREVQIFADLLCIYNVKYNKGKISSSDKRRSFP